MLKIRQDNLIDWISLDRFANKDGLINLKQVIYTYFKDFDSLTQKQKEWLDCVTHTMSSLLASDYVDLPIAALAISIIRASLVSIVSINSSVEMVRK